MPCNAKNQKDCNITFNTHYVELKDRIYEDLIARITLAIDILQMNEPPTINEKCNDCNFFKRQSQIIL